MRGGQSVGVGEVPDGMLSVGPWDKGGSVRPLCVSAEQPLWLKLGMDLSTAESASDYIVCETMPDMTPSASPACEAVVSVGSDRLATAARVRSDQRGSQTQPHRDAELIVSQAEPERAGWESLQPGVGSFCFDRQQPGTKSDAAAMRASNWPEQT